MHERVYRYLIHAGRPRSVDEVAASLQLSPRVAGAVLRELERQGLATQRTSRPPRYEASPPELALAPLLARRREELADIQHFAHELQGTFTRAGGPHTDVVDIVLGRDQAIRYYLHLLSTARTSVESLRRPPYATGQEAAELLAGLGAAVERGVRARSVYESDGSEADGAVAGAVPIGAGATLADGSGQLAGADPVPFVGDPFFGDPAGTEVPFLGDPLLGDPAGTDSAGTVPFLGDRAGTELAGGGRLANLGQLRELPVGLGRDDDVPLTSEGVAVSTFAPLADPGLMGGPPPAGAMLAVAERAIAVGDQARASRQVPTRLTLFDRQIAVVSLTSNPAGSDPLGLESADLDDAPYEDGWADDGESLLPADWVGFRTAGIGLGAVVVRPSPLLDALAALFDNVWNQAVPVLAIGDGLMLGSADSGEELDDRSRQVLLLMSDGLKDESIARALGLSRRTVQKCVTTAMTRLGARTRFQAALLAQKRGWLG